MKFLWLLGALFVYLKGAACFDYKYYYLDNQCGQSVYISLDEAVVLQFSSAYNGNKRMDCQVTFVVLDRLTVDFQDLDLKSDFPACSSEWIELHDGSSDTSSSLTYKDEYCGTSHPNSVLPTTGGYVTIRYVLRERLYRDSKLKIVLTPFHTGTCLSDEIRCDNGRCLQEGVDCTTYNPCGDYSTCIVGIGTAVTVAIIVGSSIASLFAVVTTVIVIACIIRQRRNRSGMRGSPGFVMNQANPGTVITSNQAYPSQGQPQGQYPGQYGGQYSTQLTYSNPTAYGIQASQTQPDNPSQS